jgi:hypothetical protein
VATFILPEGTAPWITTRVKLARTTKVLMSHVLETGGAWTRRASSSPPTSAAMSEPEGVYARSWARNIWADTLG